MEHTKGPWAWQEFGKDDVCLTAQHGKREIILAGHPDGTLRMNENSTGRLEKINREHPNAKLIEAAPELYEALQIILANPFDVHIIEATAKSAIQKVIL